MNGFYPLSSENIKSNLIWGKRQSLTYVYIELTNRCNLTCEYCQVDANDYFDMAFEKIVNIIDQLSDMKVFELRLGGGEPLLYKKIYDVIKYARERGIFVWLCTNGYNLDKKTAVKLKSSGLTGIRVSIDSTNPVIHDKVRNCKGAWFHCIDAILNAKMVCLETVISMTVGSHNIDEYELMCKMANGLDCQLSTHFVMPKGKGKTFPKISNSKSGEIINNLKGEKHCVAATETIYIDVCGNVSACSFLKPVASVNDYSLKEIMNLPQMIKFTKPIKSEKCRECQYGTLESCPLSNVCRGGCWVKYE